MSSNPFAIIQTALKENRGDRRSRDVLRRELGREIDDIILDLARGKAWMATLPDGRQSAPVLPSSDVRLRAAIYLHESYFGKAVAQTEISKAEEESKNLEAVRALSDAELELEASKILDARRVNRLSPGTTEAEFVVHDVAEDVTIPDLANRIWLAAPAPEDD